MKMLSYWDQWFHDFMQERYSQPRGRSLYIWTCEGLRQALWCMFTQWIAARFPPYWIYEVWVREPGYEKFLIDADNWVGGATYGYFLHQADAEKTVEKLLAKGWRAGWEQQHLSSRYRAEKESNV